MRLHVDQRHERVLELVRERGSLRVAELASELGVSAVTLRRDVETLAAQGRVQRLHGAVVWPTEQSTAEAVPQPPAAEGVVIGMIVPTTTLIFADIVRGRERPSRHRGADWCSGCPATWTRRTRYRRNTSWRAGPRACSSLPAGSAVCRPAARRNGCWTAPSRLCSSSARHPRATPPRCSTGCAPTAPTVRRKRSVTSRNSATARSPPYSRKVRTPRRSPPATWPPWRRSG